MDVQWELVFRRWSFMDHGYIIGHCLIFIDAEESRIGADKAFVENSARQGVEVLVFQGFQVPAGDLGGFRDLIQSNSPHFPIPPELIAK